MMDTLIFNKNGQWSLNKYELVGDQKFNPRFRMANWPTGLNQNTLDRADTKSKAYEKAIEEPRKVMVDGKEMWHHVIKHVQSNRIRHLLSFSSNPNDDGVSQIQGQQLWNKQDGHHMSITGKLTVPEHERKGYMSALFRSALDYHGALCSDDTLTLTGESQSLKFGNELKKDPKYTFHPGISNSAVDKVVENGKKTTIVPHRMWFKRKDHKVDKKDALGLIPLPKKYW